MALSAYQRPSLRTSPSIQSIDTTSAHHERSVGDWRLSTEYTYFFANFSLPLAGLEPYLRPSLFFSLFFFAFFGLLILLTRRAVTVSTRGFSAFSFHTRKGGRAPYCSMAYSVCRSWAGPTKCGASDSSAKVCMTDRFPPSALAGI